MADVPMRILLVEDDPAYAELTRVLNTTFVNPDGAITIVADPPDTCDLTKMTVQWGGEGVTDGDIAADLERIHRFVREPHHHAAFVLQHKHVPIPVDKSYRAGQAQSASAIKIQAGQRAQLANVCHQNRRVFRRAV